MKDKNHKNLTSSDDSPSEERKDVKDINEKLKTLVPWRIRLSRRVGSSYSKDYTKT